MAGGSSVSCKYFGRFIILSVQLTKIGGIEIYKKLATDFERVSTKSSSDQVSAPKICTPIKL